MGLIRGWQGGLCPAPRKSGDSGSSSEYGHLPQYGIADGFIGTPYSGLSWLGRMLLPLNMMRETYWVGMEISFHIAPFSCPLTSCAEFDSLTPSRDKVLSITLLHSCLHCHAVLCPGTQKPVTSHRHWQGHCLSYQLGRDILHREKSQALSGSQLGFAVPRLVRTSSDHWQRKGKGSKETIHGYLWQATMTSQVSWYHHIVTRMK